MIPEDYGEREQGLAACILHVIPPRPWRVEYNTDDSLVHGIVDATGRDVVLTDCGVNPPNAPTAELIVRLVNAEPEIVEALEAAEKVCAWAVEEACRYDNGSYDFSPLEKVRAALAKVRP